MPDHRRDLVCRRGPRSLPGGRIVTQDATAKDIDTSDPLVADLISQGDLEVVEKPSRGRKPADKEEGK